MRTPFPQPTRSEPVGAEIFAGTVEEAAQLVVAKCLTKDGGYAVLCNVHVLMSSLDQREISLSLDQAWRVFPDGAPVAWLQRRLGDVGARRVGGPDLMPAVFDSGRTRGIRHFLFGSEPEVIDGVCDQLRSRFPGAQISGIFAPPLGSEDSESSLDEIRSAAPNIVWVALGAPKQELWMRRHADELHPSLLIGVGAAFDFEAGVKRRAPHWMQRAGLEWLHRLGAEPRRLSRRYLSTNSAFVLFATRLLAKDLRTRLRANTRAAEG